MRWLPLVLFAVAVAGVALWMTGSEPSDDGKAPAEPPVIPPHIIVEDPLPPLVEVPEPPRPAGNARSARDILKLGRAWLAAQQNEDGSWHSEFDDETRPAVTGLVLLAFLGTGETHKSGNYKKTVKSGLKYLKTQQRPDGGYGPYERSDYAANDSIATLAMSEAYGMTGSPLFKQSAQLGVDHVAKRGISRIWDVMVMKSARTAGLRVPESWEQDALRWLDSVTDARTGAARWESGGMVPASEAAQTAAAAWGRILATPEPEKDVIVRALKFVTAHRPDDHLRDPGRVLFSTRVVRHVYTAYEKEWGEWLRAILIPVGAVQERGEGTNGSWAPAGDGARLLGRTGITALTLQGQILRHRHVRVFRSR